MIVPKDVPAWWGSIAGPMGVSALVDLKGLPQIPLNARNISYCSASQAAAQAETRAAFGKGEGGALLKGCTYLECMLPGIMCLHL